MLSASRHAKSSMPNFKEDYYSTNDIIGQYWNECSSSPEIQMPHDNQKFGKGHSHEKLAASPFRISESRGNLFITGHCQQNRWKDRAPSPFFDINTKSFMEGKVSPSIVPNFDAANRAQARSTLSYDRLIKRWTPRTGMLNASST